MHYNSMCFCVSLTESGSESAETSSQKPVFPRVHVLPPGGQSGVCGRRGSHAAEVGDVGQEGGEGGGGEEEEWPQNPPGLLRD